MDITTEHDRVWVQSREDLNFPWLGDLGAGRLSLAFSRGRHGGSEWPHLLMSEDGGETWLDYPDHPGGKFITLRNGTLFGMKPEEGFALKRPCSYFRQYTSLDHGRSWTSSLEGATEMWGHKFNPQNPPLELEDGGMLQLCNGREVEKGNHESHCAYLLERRPEETIWRIRSSFFQGRPEFRERPNENALALLSGNRMVAVARTGYPTSPMIMATSADGGYTWSEQRELPWSGVDPTFYRLGNGVLLLIQGERRSDKTGALTVRALLDEGETWSEPFIIYDGPGTSYHTAIDLAPDRLLLTYNAGMFRQSSLPQYSAPGEYNQICAVELTATP